MKIFGYSAFGYEGALVNVEADLRDGIPAVDIVGLADSSVKESRERMKIAIINSGLDFPQGRVLLSLSPADLKKEGASFDLAMAMAVLDAQNSACSTDSWLCYGELELSGNLRPVRGTYAALQTAVSCGIKKALVPADVSDAEIPDGITVWRIATLKDAWLAVHLASPGKSEKTKTSVPVSESEVAFPVDGTDGTIDDIKNPALVRAMMIAAAGRHHLLVVGKPGCGKTAALMHFPELLPALTNEESQSVARIHSIAGLFSSSNEIMRTPPFRMPHQTASIEGMCGGGVNCRPGEISLAHNGVLFLDEAAEFKASVLQMLRVPLETHSITLSRAGRSTVYPANFQLLMATNPCPCGNFGSETKLCLCSGKSIEQYWRKFSAPLLDRIAIRVYETEKQEGIQPTLAEMREKIAVATKIQRKRGIYNQNLSADKLISVCEMTGQAKTALDGVADISVRGRSNALRVARTIADLDGAEKIDVRHIEESIKLSAWTLPLMM